VVHKINSRDAFVNDLKTTIAIHNSSGKPEITVVNIQKFENDPDVVTKKDYEINIQRVYFLDEVHRSYNPKGSFLANLKESDINSIKIGLTGTPLLGDEYNSKMLFGDYIHKYYYNASIADGYTLRLIREEIETVYHLKFKQILEEFKVLKGETDRKESMHISNLLSRLLEYIVQDFEKSRMTLNDPTIGAMVICDSSEQAEELKEVFDYTYAEHESYGIAADNKPEPYGKNVEDQYKVRSAALILHDAGSKVDREKTIEDFKDGKIDFSFCLQYVVDRI
jgi:type I restriction enzyme R subunit